MAETPRHAAGNDRIEDQAARVVAYFERELGYLVCPACAVDGSVIFTSSDGAIAARLSPDGQRVQFIENGKVVDERLVSELCCEDSLQQIADEIPPYDSLFSDQYYSKDNSQKPLCVDAGAQHNQSAKQFVDTSAKYTNPYPENVPEVNAPIARKESDPSHAEEAKCAGSEGSDPTGSGRGASSSPENPAPAEVSGVIFPDHAAAATDAALVPGVMLSQDSAETCLASSSNLRRAMPAAGAEGQAATATDNSSAKNCDHYVANLIDGALFALRPDALKAEDRSQHGQKHGALKMKATPPSGPAMEPQHAAAAVPMIAHRGVGLSAARIAEILARRSAHVDPFAAPAANGTSAASLTMSPFSMNNAHTVESDPLMMLQANAGAGLLTLNFPFTAEPSVGVAGEERFAVRVEKSFDPQHARDHGERGQDSGERGQDDRGDEDQPEISA